jgi:hypothetical protein
MSGGVVSDIQTRAKGEYDILNSLLLQSAGGKQKRQQWRAGFATIDRYRSRTRTSKTT